MGDKDFLFIDPYGNLCLQCFCWYRIYVDGFVRRAGHEHVPEILLRPDDFVFAMQSNENRETLNKDYF